MKFSNTDRNILNPCCSEDAAVALGFGGRAHGLGVVVRELDGGAAVDFAELADQADGVEAVVAVGIAVAKVVGEQVPQPALKRMRRSGSPSALGSRKSAAQRKSAGAAPLRIVPAK